MDRSIYATLEVRMLDRTSLTGRPWADTKEVRMLNQGP